MARNRSGQFVRTGNLEVVITKQLQEIANEVAIRVKPIVRDELERTHRANIYASYQPATAKGKDIKDYNNTHKHQKTKLYHHTGRLASSVYAIIEGNHVIAKIRDQKYEDGASTTEVYNYLKYGTAKTSDKIGFFYNNGKDFSPYISQQPHNFETRTAEDMNVFLTTLAHDLNTHPERYSNKYRNKRI